MSKSLRLLASIAAVAAPLAVLPAVAAHADSGTTYTATLNSINKSGGSGMLKLTLTGSEASITENWSGLASTFSGNPYPHVQHIHINGKGQCPTQSADKNGDGIVDTVEGVPAYGMVGTTLSTSGDTSAKAATNIKTAPSGSSTNYQRTFKLDSATAKSIRNGTAVIVVHGLDPSGLSKKAQGEKSHLAPSLPLAATSPALCGALASMPGGAPQTGAGTTGGVEDMGLFGLGAGLVTAAGALFLMRKRGFAANRASN